MGSVVGTDKIAAAKTGLSVEEWRLKKEQGLSWCYCCKNWKALNLFSVDKSRGNKRAASCKSCSSHKSTACRYKISLEEAKELRSGNKKCEICERKQKLEVDHNHKTGKVRGVLCSRCNGALGQFLDNIEMLKRAIMYLERKDG